MGSKYVAVIGAVGTWWLVKEGYIDIGDLVAIAVGYWLITKLWEDFIDL